jgi:hypothetical protein
VSANHCARLIRACYRRETRLDRTLPPQLPTSAVDFNKEEASQDALDFKDFPKWRKAWDKIEDANPQSLSSVLPIERRSPGRGRAVALEQRAGQ